MANSKADQALELFQSGYNCAQAVFAALSTEVDIDHETAFRVAAGFGGGMAGTGRTCGALSGALMALGGRFGRRDPADKQKKAQMYALSQKAIQMFVERTGARNCCDLLGFDLGTEEGRKAAAEKPDAFAACPDLVQTAVHIAEELLNES